MGGGDHVFCLMQCLRISTSRIKAESTCLLVYQNLLKICKHYDKVTLNTLTILGLSQNKTFRNNTRALFCVLYYHFGKKKNLKKRMLCWHCILSRKCPQAQPFWGVLKKMYIAFDQRFHISKGSGRKWRL